MHTLLTQWQKKQAALLYHFSSMKYLLGLKDRVDRLRAFAEGRIDESRSQGRDRYLHSAQWGDRNTTENWANNAWPFLADFQLSIARAIADLPSEIYHVTGASQCERGVSEVSMQWATKDEEKQFDAMIAEISSYAGEIDYTMQKRYSVSRWNDFGLTLAWVNNSEEIQPIPKFRIQPDIVSAVDELPPRTGVYVSLDDPNAALQFAWRGGHGGKIIMGSTFNDLGLEALSAIGRTKLWVDEIAMRDFICANMSHPALKDDPYIMKGHPQPSIAPSLIARNGFTTRSGRWCLVELIEGEFETVEGEVESPASSLLMKNRRFSAGEICEHGGFYFTPARLNSRRRFEIGDVFPSIDSTYGKTIWQWDMQQTGG